MNKTYNHLLVAVSCTMILGFSGIASPKIALGEDRFENLKIEIPKIDPPPEPLPISPAPIALPTFPGEAPDPIHEDSSLDTSLGNIVSFRMYCGDGVATKLKGYYDSIAPFVGTYERPEDVKACQEEYASIVLAGVKGVGPECRALLEGLFGDLCEYHPPVFSPALPTVLGERPPAEEAAKVLQALAKGPQE